MSVVLTWFHKSTIPVFMSCLNCVGSFLLYLNLYILPKPSSFYRYNCRGSFSVHTALGFIRCKGLLSRLILRLEVYSLQILPFRERVIGRESRRMKLYRQPFTASIKFQGGSDGKEPTRGKEETDRISPQQSASGNDGLTVIHTEGRPPIVQGEQT